MTTPKPASAVKTRMTQTTNFDYEKFFRNARGWVFQAAQINPEEVISIGSMEWMYQAFKARMEAEAKADYEREMRMSKDSVTTPTAQALATIKDSLEYICNDESLQPIQAARNALKALSTLTAALEPSELEKCGQSDRGRELCATLSKSDALEPRQQAQDAPQSLRANDHRVNVEHGNAPAPQAQPSAMNPAEEWADELFYDEDDQRQREHVITTVHAIQRNAIRSVKEVEN